MFSLEFIKRVLTLINEIISLKNNSLFLSRRLNKSYQANTYNILSLTLNYHSLKRVQSL